MSGIIDGCVLEVILTWLEMRTKRPCNFVANCSPTAKQHVLGCYVRFLDILILDCLSLKNRPNVSIKLNYLKLLDWRS